MDTNKMLIPRRLQVGPPSPPLSSGGLSVPTPLPCVSPRVLLGYRRLLRTPQRGCGPPIGSSLFARLFIGPRFEYMQMLQWFAPSKETPTAAAAVFPPPGSLPFPRSFPFCLCANCGRERWEPATQGQICFVTGIYLAVRLVTVNCRGIYCML